MSSCGVILKVLLTSASSEASLCDVFVLSFFNTANLLFSVCIITAGNTGKHLYAYDTVPKPTNKKDSNSYAHQLALLEVNDYLKRKKLTLNIRKPRLCATD